MLPETKFWKMGFIRADSVLKAFPKRFYRENITGFKPQTLSSGLQFEFGFHFSYLQQRKKSQQSYRLFEEGPGFLECACSPYPKEFQDTVSTDFSCRDQLESSKALIYILV